MTKATVSKSNWEANYNNKSLSGIEVKDKNGKLVNFITIRHDEILKNKQPHRITISLNEKSEPLLPPPQTFEEMLTAKRRHQMLLYGSGTSRNVSSNVQTPSRGVVLHNEPKVSIKTKVNNIEQPRVNSESRTSSSKPKNSSEAKASAEARVNAEARVSAEPKVKIETKLKFEPKPCTEPKVSTDPIPSTSGQVIKSIKDFKQNPPLKLDPKEVKIMLKYTPPGGHLVLPDGTLIKKSRRGGARAGAGRKRSRPLLPGQQPPPTSLPQQQQQTNQTSTTPRNSNGSPSVSSNTITNSNQPVLLTNSSLPAVQT